MSDVDLTAEFDFSRRLAPAISALVSPARELRAALDRLASVINTAPPLVGTGQQQLDEIRQSLQALQDLTDGAVHLGEMGQAMAADLDAMYRADAGPKH